MKNISEFIEQNETLKELDFVTCYVTILELIISGHLKVMQDV